MANDLVSVIMLNYNSMRLIDPLFESLALRRVIRLLPRMLRKRRRLVSSAHLRSVIR